MSAARRARLDRKRRRNSLILCTRIGHTGNTPIPAGYQTADCVECGAAVWVGTWALDASRLVGTDPLCLCNVCQPLPPELW